jgi:tricorn protease
MAGHIGKEYCVSFFAVAVWSLCGYTIGKRINEQQQERIPLEEAPMKRPLLLMLVLLIPAAARASNPGYYRFPAIHEDAVIFTAEGDLWRVDIGGGIAQRLTSHPGMEAHPAVSPDGSTLAFTAQYEGPTEVYTMPLAGGLPRRRSYWGRWCRVVGWTPGGRLIAATHHFSTLPNTQAVLIDLESGDLDPIPLAQASDGDFDVSGSTFFFTRFAFQGSHTKRYRGGTAQNIWRFSDGDREALPLTPDYPGTSRNPMWWDGRVYFASDRDGTMNIWSMGPEGGDLRQHTFHSGWDVRTPDLDRGRIVYQAGADLYLYDIETGEGGPIPIVLPSDFDQTRDKWVDEPFDYLTSTHISPEGDRVVLVSRGRVFVAPAGQGRLVEAGRQDGIRYRDARFTSDGETILALSDRTGEWEFWRLPARGFGELEQLTGDGTVFRVEGVPSPDGKWIAHTDRNHKLWLYEERTGRSTMITHSEQDIPRDLTWSPDSKWLAFVSEAENYYDRLMLYSIKDRTLTALTGERVDSYSPAWSPDGLWLYFLSDRYFASVVRSPWGQRQPEPYFDRTTKIYHVPLKAGLRSPFQPDDELLARVPEAGEDEKSDGKASDMEPPIVEIDLGGIEQRGMEIPIEAGNYRKLTANAGHLFWRETESGLQPVHNLVSLKIGNEDLEPQTVVEAVTSYELSLDGKKLLVAKGDNLYVIDASGEAPGDLEKEALDLSDWAFPVDPRDEWRQMLVEAWRFQRDFFYDPGLHGVDWPAVLEKHLPLVDRVSDRDELSDLIGQMVSEISALHTYIWGGDRREGPEDIAVGSLGAVLERDDRASGYRISHIYQTDPDYPENLGPLSRPGVDIEEGDIILSINGVPTLSTDHPAVILRNQVDKQVLLEVKSMPSGGTEEFIVTPISPRAERDLRYSEWEYTRRLTVEELGDGEIGYVHLRAMGGRDFSEWVRSFYPVFDRKGLIVDVRHNGGGNIDSWILEKLLRRAWFYWKSRIGRPYWNMQYAFRGHMVVLCDEWTASDGEAFTEGFRRLGLGKVIGTRTWGGEIWLSSSNFRLNDRGFATAAQSGVYGPEGDWLIEGHGVEPDIVVDNLPHSTFMGEDAQLEAAVRYLKDLIAAEPVEVPPTPPYPDKSFQYE